jgi:sugar lactone lactonase YvrE
MRRWSIAVVSAVLMLIAAQPALAGQEKSFRNFANLATASCHNPEGIEADRAGNLYAAGLSGNICVVNSSGVVTRVIPVAAGHALLGELLVPGQGLYVADNNGDFSGGRVVRVNLATGVVTVIASGFAAPNAFERRNGLLFVSDSFAGAISTVNPTTHVKALWKADALLQPNGNPPFGANGLAFDRQGRFLYVANTSTDRILRIAVNRDGSAGAISIFADGATINARRGTTGALDGADGITFDKSGRLWVAANQADQVQVLSKRGSLIKRFAGTGDNALHFPASPIFVGRSVFVTNLYFGTFGGKLSVLDGRDRDDENDDEGGDE